MTHFAHPTDSMPLMLYIILLGCSLESVIHLQSLTRALLGRCASYVLQITLHQL